MPSYKTSTLSLMVLEYFRSLKYLIVIVIAVAYFSPETYTAISQEKTLVLVAFGAYTALWIGLYSAYLQRSQLNTAPAEDKPVVKPLIEMNHEEYLKATDTNSLHDNNDLKNVG